MKKLINFIKKPLLIISSIIFAIFAIVLVATSLQKHGKKYVYSDTFVGIGLDLSYTFESENLLTLEMVVAGEVIEEKYQYLIQDDNLYIFNTSSNSWERDGEIDAYEIEIRLPIEAELGIMSGIELDLICKTNVVIKVISIVMMAIFGVVAAGSLAVLILDKKGIFKIKSEKITIESIESKDKENAIVEVQEELNSSQEN